MAAILPQNRALTTLYLSSNQIGAVGADALAAAMQSNTQVTHMFLRHNPCSAAGTGNLVAMKAIAEACQVRRRVLDSVQFSRCAKN